MTRSRLILTIAIAPLAISSALSAQSSGPKRPLRLGDFYRVRNVGGPEISPDGRWVAYTVTTIDSAKDKSNTDVWMSSWDGTQTIQLTSSPDAETSPKWSPDGKFLSFLSSREGGKSAQLWLLDRRGGEAQRISELKDGIDEYEWAPDSKRMAIIMRPSLDTTDSANAKPKPIVIDRYHFKDDGNGYLDSARAHLYVFDLATKKATLLTPGTFEESSPAWSPDGRSIAFASVRPEGMDPDRTNNSDIFVIEARAGATPRRLTTFPGPDTGPIAWSPDGQTIAYLQGSEPRFYAYDEPQLAVVDVNGGRPRVVTAALDRPVASPHFSADGGSIVFVYADDRAAYVGRVATSGGAVQALLSGRRAASGLAVSKDGKMAVLAGTATQPNEIFALENGSLRALSHHNDAWLAEVKLGSTEDVSFKTKDGNEAHGLLVKPADFAAGTNYPLLLRIHGGPSSQDQHSFSFERELLAANGYLVLNVNYRGSFGRGEAYEHAIYADWGNKEVVDLLAGVDYVVGLGIADPARLGIGGWSYGGILTDYTIATTTRFKAAIAGAGSALQTSMYGVDEYVFQYDTELGPPWKSQALWIKLSYPFYHADRITTPTLYMGGDKDFNVPLVGGEQMYQALRSLGVPTQLVIYPDQHHGLTRPSFNYDRLARYVAWYDKFLKPSPVQAGGVRP